jgi:hypothetical protein
MTERQWRGRFDSDRHLEACEWLPEDKKNHRKLRLWSCACCRRLGDLLADKRSWHAIEVAERKADGLADKDEMQKARKAAALVPQVRQKLRGTPAEWAASAPRWLLHPSAFEFSRTAAIRASIAMAESGATTRDAEDKLQFELLRDIFGNLFRPVTIPPTVLAWDDAAVVRLAQAAYEERHLPSGLLDNARLAVLADALEEAGCDDRQILEHLRSGGDHVRGCFVVDLILAKE